MIRRLCCAGALAVALVASSIPAAHAATVPPDEWAPKFCTALNDYQQAISTEKDTLDSNLQSITSLKEGRAELVAFLGKMVTAAKGAKAAIQDAGVPDVPNGKKISAAFVGALDDSATIFAKSKSQAAKVSVKNAAAFKKQGAKVGTDLQKAGTQLSESLGSLRDLDAGQQLQTAGNAAPECAALAS